MGGQTRPRRSALPSSSRTTRSSRLTLCVPLPSNHPLTTLLTSTGVQTLEHVDCSFMVDNEAIYDICRKKYALFDTLAFLES